MAKLALWILCLCLAACKDRGPTQSVHDGGVVGRRVFRPPPQASVRAVPPHNIHSKGVGPYELGADLHSILGMLATGPRVELFEVEGLFDYHLVRADNNALTIGVRRRGGVQFVSVLDPDIARTESGVGVGAKVADLVVALGAIQPAVGGERDARLVVFAALPHTRFVVEDGEVIAAVVVRSDTEARDAGDAAVSTESCDVSVLAAGLGEVIVAARLGEEARASFGCHKNAPIAAVWSGETVVFVGVEGDKLRRFGPVRVAGLDFVGFLRVNGQWSAFAVSQRADPKVREVEITPLRLEGARLLTEARRSALRLSASSAGYVGASLSQAEFLVELSSTDQALEVSGLFIQREGKNLRNVVPVVPASLAVGRPPGLGQGSRPVGGDGGPTRDAGAGARDAGSQ